MPTFAPEHFVVARPVDGSRSKHFRRSIAELDEEAVVQVLVPESRGDLAPILAAVGQLQYEVVSARMTGEFSVPVRLEPLPYHLALATDEAGAEALRRFPITCEVVTRVSDKARLALFRNRWQADALRRERPDIRLNRLIAADD